jgi:hypothetical protein
MSDPRNDAHDKKVAHEKKKVEPVVETAVLTEVATAPPSAALEASRTVLAQLKELEFHSRAHIERLAQLAMTVEDELKQKDFAAPLQDVYSAQSAVQTKLTALIEAYGAATEPQEA